MSNNSNSNLVPNSNSTSILPKNSSLKSNQTSNQNLHPIYQTIYIELLILQSNLLKGIVDVAIENVSKDLSLILEDLSDKLFEVSSLLERVSEEG